jgi:coatomer subunit beta'
MHLTFNPKDSNTFASAGLDGMIKVWSLGSPVPNFTLEGHGKGVNFVDYYHGGDKPYLISCADDNLVKIWDYQNKNCVQTLEGHNQNVNFASFHPNLPIILSGSEDGTVRIWNSDTYRLENTLNYGLERSWCVATQKNGNNVALGYDEGTVVIKLGREEPAVSMDLSGKIIWAKHTEIQTTNIKTGIGMMNKRKRRQAIENDLFL